MSLEQWNTLLEIASVAVVALTFLIGAAALWTSHEVSKRQAERIATIGAESARANERSAALEVEGAAQRERAAVAERQLLELQQRIAPRHLSPTERNSLTQSLTAADPKGLLTVTAAGNDPEAYAFAEEIWDVLRSADWPTTGPVQTYIAFPPGPPGLELQLRIRTAAEPPAYAVALQQAFQAAGIELPAARLPRLDNAEVTIWIRVGTKP